TSLRASSGGGTAYCLGAQAAARFQFRTVPSRWMAVTPQTPKIAPTLLMPGTCRSVASITIEPRRGHSCAVAACTDENMARAAIVCRTTLASALRKVAAEHAFGDAVLEDFDRAAGDHPAAAAAQAVLDERLLAVAGGAHDLQRFVRRIEAGLVAGELGERGVLGRGQAAVGVGGRLVEKELRRL